MSATVSPHHTLKIDYTNHSAQVLDADGRCVAIYSHVHGRAAVIVRAARDGWLLQGDAWSYTWPPDGRQHPLIHRPHPEIPVSDPLPLNPGATDDAVATQIIDHFGPGTWVIGLTGDGPHATVHRADLACPRRPHCGMTSHGVPATMIRAIGVLDSDQPYFVIKLLTELGMRPCRPCKRCWRPTWKFPAHDPAICFSKR